MNYFLYSEDKFLIKKNIDLIYKTYAKKHNNIKAFNYSILEDNLNDILMNYYTNDFFSTFKFIIVNDCFFTTNKKTKFSKSTIKNLEKEIIRCLKNPNDNVCLILTVQTDKLNNKSELTKTILNLTKLNFLEKLNINQIKQKIQAYIKIHDGQTTSETLNLFLNYLPNDLNIIFNELKKLLSINSNITNEVVKNNLTHFFEADIFQFINLLMKNKTSDFLEHYYFLQNKGLDYNQLISIILSNFALISNIKVLKKQNYNFNQIVKKLKVHPYRLEQLTKYANKFSNYQIKYCLDILTNMDYLLKTNNYNYKKTILDWYIIKLLNIHNTRQLFM